MFNKPVVFVIGAGASREYKFPLGAELKDTIAIKIRFRFQRYYDEPFEGDPDLFNQIRKHAPDQDRRNAYTKAANVLSAAIGTFISIDEALHFVGGSAEAVEVGKIAIIHEILKAERNSSLAIDRQTGRLDINHDNGGWIEQMLSMALAGLQREKLEKVFDQITFINFNYDRSLEQYLYWALQQRASASEDQAKSIIESLNVIRPYGTIGPLSWQTNGTAFGTSENIDLFALVDRIRTYTESKPLHDSDSMNRALANAQLVIFLGFGYHATNLDILGAPATPVNASVLGTVVGVHPENLAVISRRISQNLHISSGNVRLVDMDATSLLRGLRQRILIAVE